MTPRKLEVMASVSKDSPSSIFGNFVSQSMCGAQVARQLGVMKREDRDSDSDAGFQNFNFPGTL